GPLSAEVAESIAHRWSSLLNDSSLTVVTVQLAKFKHHPGLGISLEGTVDVLETGAEVRPHHYIRAIQPDGPVAADGTLRPHDELLEVNGKKLYGLNHLEVVEILKNLPKYVRIVCARPVQNRLQQEDGDVAAACRDDADSLDIDQMDDDDLMTTRSRTTRESQPEADLSAADGNANTATLPSRGGSGSGNNKSQSFDDFSNTGYWSNIPTVVELEKTPAGLGFSVLDYQDPLSADETVIIIRSLVPNGAAHRDGRLLPGDRLLFVNDTNLERASLEETVRCLKSAPRGRIAIGVAKPRPLASASAERKTSIVDNRHLPASSGPRQRRQQQWLKTRKFAGF
uniref:PDZ domain-containing protein n=1 Tax=Macrostomum lignano TaxID=282301 RepID=A0A1I8IM29_9PLAT